MDNRGIDMDPGWINRKLREIERAIEALRSERRAAATTITDGDLIVRGGGKFVVDGGDFLLLDTDGSTVFRLGPQTHGDRGVSIYREDGTVVLSTAKRLSTQTVQQWSMRDASGNEIVSETLFGDGLERPYLPIPLQPVAATGTPAPTLGPYGFEMPTTSETFVDLFRWQGPRQNRWYRPIFNVRLSDTTTAAELRVVNADGTILAGLGQPAWTGVIAAGSTDDTSVTPPYGLGLSNSFMATQVVRVQVRRTAGAGTVTTSVRQSQAGGA